MSTKRIRELNDRLRSDPVMGDGNLYLTKGVVHKGADFANRAIMAMRLFNSFPEECEAHDFGTFEVDGVACYFRIEYFANDGDGPSLDPGDWSRTMRILTLALVEEDKRRS